MIVTRSWLNEFINLKDISNEKLYETFNNIGLEVDSLTQIVIPEKVVIGKIISCEKHPDADKLNVCQIDVGSGIRQIVCGAANVVDAEYVAVATIGAELPGDLKIKHAKLRGVESEGMVCSASELGLPSVGQGIMILDQSIGLLEVGRELRSYDKIADTIIELELTANRGDCLSIYGVARDLSAALDIEMKSFEYKQEDKVKLGIARVAEIQTSGDIDADLLYKLITLKNVTTPLLVTLRLAMCDLLGDTILENMLAYATHTTGVILRTYSSDLFKNSDNKIVLQVVSKASGLMELIGNGKVISQIGINQKIDRLDDVESIELVIEGSYVEPDVLVEAVATASCKTDDLYYKTSRGSNPNLSFGISYLASMFDDYGDLSCYEGSLGTQMSREHHTLIVDAKEISSIIGMEVEIGKIVTILKKLGFEINTISHNVITAIVPQFRHDIANIQDISEEIVRMIGINHIDAKPFVFTEKPRFNETTDRYKVKKELRHRAVGAQFYENVSYLFTEKALLETYGFGVIEEELDLANPIAEELNTLRTTILVNLLNAVKRNVNYGQKSIPLFEIGSIFDTRRNEREMVSLIFSGYIENESVKNNGKPKMIDFSTFIQKLGAILGVFDLVPCSFENGLIHPYQSANIVIDGSVCGFVSKVHPSVQEAFGIPQTFIAELDLGSIMPKHINATPISKFQGTYKDLSVVIDKSIQYVRVAQILHGVKNPLLKESYPVDIYEDATLGDQKSLTIRFFIQSMDKTLEESDIESVIGEIMEALKTGCNAQLR
ncbi:MAG: hypothetical protein RLZZ428_951 [Pseudomonadota bacterium]